MSTQDEGGAPPRPARRRWLTVVSGTVVAVLVVVLAILAVRSPGRPVHDVSLGDGTVWVSGGQTTYWARVDPGAHGFDLVIPGAGSSGPEQDVVRPDVLQDGRHAVGVTVDRTLVPFDTRTGEVLEGRPKVPDPQVETGEDFYMPGLVDLRGSTIAMVERTTGRVWAQRLDPKGGDDLTGFHTGLTPVATVGPDAAVAVDIYGNVKAVSAQRGVVVDVPAEGAGFGEPEEESLGFSGRLADITAVGDRWVVMDGETGNIYHEGQTADPRQIPDGGSQPGLDLVMAALQQPGPDADKVGVQTITTAAFVDLDSSTGRAEIASGLDENDAAIRNHQISRPLATGECLLAAWGQQSVLLFGEVCGDEQVQVSQIFEAGDVGRRAGVAVRYNRGRRLLNDLDTGRVFDLDLAAHENRIDTWPKGAPRRSGNDPAR